MVTSQVTNYGSISGLNCEVGHFYEGENTTHYMNKTRCNLYSYFTVAPEHDLSVGLVQENIVIHVQ